MSKLNHDTLWHQLTEEEDYKDYDHGEEEFIPKPGHFVPYSQLEDTLPSAKQHKNKVETQNCNSKSMSNKIALDAA